MLPGRLSQLADESSKVSSRHISRQAYDGAPRPMFRVHWPLEFAIGVPVFETLAHRHIPQQNAHNAPEGPHDGTVCAGCAGMAERCILGRQGLDNALHMAGIWPLRVFGTSDASYKHDR